MAHRFLRKKLKALLVIAILSGACHAQNSKIDSLTAVLKTQKEDTGKANTLNALSRQLWQTANYPQARKYADDALALAETLKFNAGRANAYNNIARGIAYSCYCLHCFDG